MRRLAVITLVIAAAAAAGALVLGARAQGSSTERVDVIFDDARGLIGGQLAKVAGAKAGTIQDVVLTPDFKARVEMSIDSRFPFHQDATCTIRPEGLIAENYVDCDPGTPDSPPLKGSGGHAATVPVTHTVEPVNLLNLFNIFNLPTRERFRVLVNELGIGVAGRGQDINAILRRANPALAQARQVISILDDQRSQLATVIDATNTIASEAAGHTAGLQSFLDRAAAVSSLTAAHSSNLALAINRLPGLLAAAQPALAQLDAVAVSGTPLVTQLHAAVPSLNRVETDLGPFVKLAKPALADLGGALKRAIPAVKDITPVVTTLSKYATKSLPSTKLAGKLFVNLQQHGFIENFLSVFYYVAATAARFDSTSHLVPAFLIDVANGACGAYATKPVAGCNAHYGQAPAFKPSRILSRRALAEQEAHGIPAPTPFSSGTPASAASTGTPGAAPTGGDARSNKLIAQILAAPTSAAGGAALHRLQQVLQGDQSQSGQTLQNLVTYLLK